MDSKIHTERPSRSAGGSASGEWVTIVEAGRQLGISERQTRRYASRLAVEDRQKPANGPTLVRLEAMMEMRANTTMRHLDEAWS